MLFDGERQTLWTIDPKQKNYSEITEADAAKIQEMRNKMEQQMKEQMSKMPPEERKKMEEMMGKSDAGPSNERRLTFEATGKEQKTDHGFSCKLYRVLDEGKLVQEACFIPWKEAGLSIQDFQVFETFEQFLKKISGGDSQHQGRIFQELKQAPGVPAHTTTILPDGAIAGEQELTELKRENIPAGQFALPSGFSKKSLLKNSEHGGSKR
jgi:DNA-binding MarR family transcriptional regulator